MSKIEFCNKPTPCGCGPGPGSPCSGPPGHAGDCCFLWRASEAGAVE